MTVSFRPADLSVREENNFIVDSWVRSFEHSHTAGMIAADRWFPVMIAEVERILARPDTRTIVAYKPGELDRLADLQGFITVDTECPTPVVFYVFVKETYRRWGYARGLFGAAGVNPTKPFVYTCATGTGQRIYHERKIPLAKWEPWVARFPKNDPRLMRRQR